MLKRNQKEELVKNLRQELSEAKTAVLVDYSSLTVKLQQDLKKRLREVGAKMMVVKNTLLKLALGSSETGNSLGDSQALQGQTALVIGRDDAVSPLQALGKFMREFELPKFKIGLVDGELRDAEGLERISKLPGREVLSAQVAGALAGPLYSLSGTLEGNLQKLVSILKAKSEMR